MKITANGIGKKFGREWVFKDLNYEFNSGQPVAITGPNGSGKSTLLQILTAQNLPSKGEVLFTKDQEEEVKADDFYQYQDIAAPYLELIEEFTLDELIEFHFKFKSLRSDIDLANFKELVYLEREGKKQIKQFSSGMKQRLKLGLCFFSESPVCFLDEPTSNLDQKGIDWYSQHITEILDSKLVIISSNQAYEYEFCSNILDIRDHK